VLKWFLERRENIGAPLLTLWVAVPTLSDARKTRSGERTCTGSNFLNNYKDTVADSNESRRGRGVRKTMDTF
jgi:hypothetical protein